MAAVVLQAGPSRDAAASMLEANGLPADDLTDAHMRHYFYAGPANDPQGLVGVEILGIDALLRSLAVAAELRTTGLGCALVQRAEAHAQEQGVRSMYLLTTTAEHFFTRRGYAKLERAKAPAGIRATREFAGLCPASSIFMFKRL